MPAPVLGVVSGHGAGLRRHAGDRRLPRGATASSSRRRSSKPRSRRGRAGCCSIRRRNPTGATYTAAEYRALAEVLARHPARPGDDRRHLRAHPLRRRSARRTSSPPRPELRDRTLAINGVSKTYAMTGWRIGWAAGPTDLIAALDTLLSQSAGNCCSVSQAAAAAALERRPGLRRRERRRLPQRRDRHAGRGSTRSPACAAALPDGAFYLYVNCARPDRQDHAGRQDAGRGRRRRHVPAGQRRRRGRRRERPTACRPTSACPSRRRIDTLDEGVARIARAVAELRP